MDSKEKVNEEIGKILADNKIDLALIAYLPNGANDLNTDDKDKKQAIIYYRGHFYEVAKLLNHVSNVFTNRIANELSHLFRS